MTPFEAVTKCYDYISRTSLTGKKWERFLFIPYDSFFFFQHDFPETELKLQITRLILMRS